MQSLPPSLVTRAVVTLRLLHLLPALLLLLLLLMTTMRCLLKPWQRQLVCTWR